jgi:hypothetical protein
MNRIDFNNKEEFNAYCAVVLENGSYLIDAIAATIHNLNTEWCRLNGDFKHFSWEEAPKDICDTMKEGVKWVLKNPDITPEEHHNNWVEHKTKEGWTFDLFKDFERKTHPCLVPFDELPFNEKWKNSLIITATLNFVRYSTGVVLLDELANQISTTFNIMDSNEN